MDTRTFNVLSLCSGVGGLDLGVNLAIPSARTVCYVENEAACCETLATRGEDNALDQAPVWTNLRTFDGKPWRGIVDCITGGYPCQPFSVAGKRAGTDDPRHLWPDVARVIREVEPAYCFFENVANHLNIGFYEVATGLQAMGYQVEAGLFSAEEVGASHKRERLFVLAYSAEPRLERRGERLANDGETVAHSPSYRHGAGNQSTRGRAIAQSTDAVSAESEGGIGELAYTIGKGLGIGGRERGNRETLQSSCGAESPCICTPLLFAPGPNDSRWSYILQQRPDLAPAISVNEAKAQSAICGMADGLDSRVDELRAIGNGVVPLVAAYALCTLAGSAAVRLRLVEKSCYG